MNQTSKNILQVVLRVILFFVFIELFLRLSGGISLYLQSKQNQSILKGTDTFRIMCVGDSNTAIGGEESYPSQLDVILNERDSSRKYEVINKGLPAADSQMIMEKIEKWIDEFKPHMVVSMMGANDRFDLRKDERKKSLLSKFKVSGLVEGVVLKLINFKSDKSINQLQLEKRESERVEDENVEVEMERKFVDKEFVKLLLYGIHLVKNKEYAKAEYVLKKLAPLDLDINFLERVYKELGTCLVKQKKYNELMHVFKFLFEHYEYSVFATDEIRELCEESEAKLLVEGLLLTLLKDSPDSQHFNGLLGSCYSEWGAYSEADKYLTKVQKLRHGAVNIVLKKNYLRLVEILTKNNIIGVFAQYPLREIDNLKLIFSDLSGDYDFVFVDNKGVFKEALNPNKYKDYFTDRDNSDFGHCTLKGNKVLAENIAKVILNRLK